MILQSWVSLILILTDLGPSMCMFCPEKLRLSNINILFNSTNCLVGCLIFAVFEQFGMCRCGWCSLRLYSWKFFFFFNLKEESSKVSLVSYLDTWEYLQSGTDWKITGIEMKAQPAKLYSPRVYLAVTQQPVIIL